MSFLNKIVFNVAFVAGYSCHKTATGLRVTANGINIAADKVDEVGNQCDVVAQGLASKPTTKVIDLEEIKLEKAAVQRRATLDALTK